MSIFAKFFANLRKFDLAVDFSVGGKIDRKSDIFLSAFLKITPLSGSLGIKQGNTA